MIQRDVNHNCSMFQRKEKDPYITCVIKNTVLNDLVQTYSLFNILTQINVKGLTAKHPILDS